MMQSYIAIIIPFDEIFREMQLKINNYVQRYSSYFPQKFWGTSLLIGACNDEIDSSPTGELIYLHFTEILGTYRIPRTTNLQSHCSGRKRTLFCISYQICRCFPKQRLTINWVAEYLSVWS